jgi:hypothetical protein
MESSDSGKSDLVKKFKDKLLTLEGGGETIGGGWDHSEYTSDDEWSYDDNEGGFENQLDVSFKGNQVTVSAGRDDKKVFTLNTDQDVDDAFEYAMKVSNLTPVEGEESSSESYSDSDDEDDDEDDEDMEGYEGHAGEGDELEYAGTYKQYDKLKRKQKEKESGLAESVKRRFALLANIKRRK